MTIWARLSGRQNQQLRQQRDALGRGLNSYVRRANRLERLLHVARDRLLRLRRERDQAQAQFLELATVIERWSASERLLVGERDAARATVRELTGKNTQMAQRLTETETAKHEAAKQLGGLEWENRELLKRLVVAELRIAALEGIVHHARGS